MAGDGEEDTDYESDPEETKLSLKMRRQEASDDEGEEGDEDEEDKSDRAKVDSGGESDGQGGAAEYENEELEEEEEYYDEDGEEIEAEKEFGGEVGVGGESEVSQLLESTEAEGQVVEEEERKDKEPSAVPTAGAFYMHDDRFRGSNVGGRHRGTFDGRKLWESKDDRKWGHDKFEEMNMERQYDERSKSFRGRSQGHGRGRGAPRGYVRGYNSRFYNENNNQNIAPKTVRGRGPIRYQARTMGKSEAPPLQNKESQMPSGKGSYANSGRANTSAAHMDSYPIPPKRFPSNLNSASLPFYPSATPNKKNSTLTQKRDDQAASANRNIRPSFQERLLRRGKNVVDSVGMEKPSIDEPSLARLIGNVHMPSASLPTNSLQSRGQGRDVPLSGSKSFQFSTQNEVRKTSSAAQTNYSVRNHVQGQGQASVPLLGQRPDNASQRPTPPQTKLSMLTLESGDEDSPTKSSQSKTALVGKGKGISQGDQMGSFLYGSGQVMGSSGTMGGSSHPAAPTFLPVMQFGGQHSGGIGVPAVGMAYPGYVSQSQTGLGNSEMTWLPVLTGGAGAFGASYCPPYISFDGSPAVQAPALPASSKDNNVSEPNNELMPQQKSELVNEKFSQRHKPRRYSEMNFSR